MGPAQVTKRLDQRVESLEPAERPRPSDDERVTEAERAALSAAMLRRREQFGVDRGRADDDPLAIDAQTDDLACDFVRDARDDVARAQLWPLAVSLDEMAPSRTRDPPAARLPHLWGVDERYEWAARAARDCRTGRLEQIVVLPHEDQLVMAPLRMCTGVLRRSSRARSHHVLDRGVHEHRRVPKLRRASCWGSGPRVGVREHLVG